MTTNQKIAATFLLGTLLGNSIGYVAAKELTYGEEVIVECPPPVIDLECPPPVVNLECPPCEAVCSPQEEEERKESDPTIRVRFKEAEHLLTLKTALDADLTTVSYTPIFKGRFSPSFALYTKEGNKKLNYSLVDDETYYRYSLTSGKRDTGLLVGIGIKLNK